MYNDGEPWISGELPEIYNFHGPPPSEMWLDIYSDYGAINYLTPKNGGIGADGNPMSSYNYAESDGFRNVVTLDSGISRLRRNTDDVDQDLSQEAANKYRIDVTRNWLGSFSQHGNFAASEVNSGTWAAYRGTRQYYGSIPDRMRFSVNLSSVSSSYHSAYGPPSSVRFNTVPTYVQVWHRPHFAKREESTSTNVTSYPSPGPYKGVGWASLYYKGGGAGPRVQWSKYLPYWIGIAEEPNGESTFNVFFPMEQTKINNQIKTADTSDPRGYKHKSDGIDLLSSKKYFDNIAGMFNSTILHFSGSTAYYEHDSDSTRDAQLHVFDYRSLGLDENTTVEGNGRYTRETGIAGALLVQNGQKSGQKITISDGENSITYEWCACPWSGQLATENMIPYSCQSETEISYSARKSSATGKVSDGSTGNVAENPLSKGNAYQALSVNSEKAGWIRRDAIGLMILELATKINRSKLKIMAAPITSDDNTWAYGDTGNGHISNWDHLGANSPWDRYGTNKFNISHLGFSDQMGMEQSIGAYLSWKSLALMPENRDVTITVTESNGQFGASENTLEIIDDLFKVKATSISECESSLEAHCDSVLLLESTHDFPEAEIIVGTYQPFAIKEPIISQNSRYLSVSSSVTPPLHPGGLTTAQLNATPPVFLASMKDPFVPAGRFPEPSAAGSQDEWWPQTYESPFVYGTKQIVYGMTPYIAPQPNINLESDVQRGSEVLKYADVYFRSRASLSETDSPGRFGFDPYVPPFLNRKSAHGNDPYIDIIVDYSGQEAQNLQIEDLSTPQVMLSHMTIETSNGLSEYTSLAGTAYQTAMSLTASLDIFNIIPNFSDPQDEGNLSSVVWTISPKWETPVMDFSDSEQTVQRIVQKTPTGLLTQLDGEYQVVTEKTTRVPYDGTNPHKLYLTSSKGMWHQYSERNTGYDLVISPHPDWPLEGYSNLATAVGFTQNENESLSLTLGQLRGSADTKKKEIAEALVVIPFEEYYDENQTIQYRTIPFYRVSPDGTSTPMQSSDFVDFMTGLVQQEGQAMVPNKELINDVRLDPGIQIQIELMSDFVIPPQYDFVRNIEGDKSETSVMFILPFYHELSESDVSNWWQNLPPDIAVNSKYAESHATHTLYASDAVNNVEHPSGFSVGDKIVGLTGDNFLGNLKWKVFKVKKRAKQSYYAKRLDSYIGEEFEKSKIKEILSSQNIPNNIAQGLPLAQELIKRRDTSWNWPYDYFSLIELVNVDVKMNIESENEEDKFNMKRQYGISEKLFNIAKRLRDYRSADE